MAHTAPTIDTTPGAVAPMKDRTRIKLAPGLAVVISAIVAVVALQHWLASVPAQEVALRVPGHDGRPEGESDGRHCH